MTNKRKLPIFIQSHVDDTPLAPNAIRVYIHLCRLAGESESTRPSDQEIGNHCFASISQNAVTRKYWARIAIGELLEAGLIE